MTQTRSSVQGDLTRSSPLKSIAATLRLRGAIRVTFAAAAVALIALTVPAGTGAQSGNIVVDTTTDGNDGECARDCTLREAIALADTSTGRWVSVPPGVYRLTLGPLTLGNDVVFGVSFAGNNSAGARTTVIDAGGRSRVVQVAPGTSAVLAGVTIRGGNAPTGGGAAIPDGAQLNLYDTILDGNTAQRGGAVSNAGDAAIFYSTLSGNRASGAGGGLSVEPTGNTAVFQSTLAGNSAGSNGGGVVSGGSLQIQNATIAGNSAAAGGGLYQESTTSASTAMWSSILADDAGGACGGSIAGIPRSTWSHNLADDGSCQFASPSEGTQGNPNLGPLRNNGGPTDTRALAAGSPAINSGDPNLCSSSSIDQRHATVVGACDIGAFEFGATPPQVQLPPPTPGETANVFKAKGTVRIKLPGSSDYIDLVDAQQVPVGTTFDTSKGRVTLIAAANNQGKTQKAWFYQGLFKFSQSKGKKPLTTLTMTGKLQCGGGGKANAAAKKNRKRRLWGDGKGRFRTKGKHSAATVVGTKWLVEDRCDGTLTKVVRGKVSVRDFKRRKTVIVKAGHQYFAKR
jgi:CSLREA domain-containing protein